MCIVLYPRSKCLYLVYLYYIQGLNILYPRSKCLYLYPRSKCLYLVYLCAIYGIRICLYIYIIPSPTLFTKHASIGGLVLQILRWPGSTCTTHHCCCGPCLQLDFLHAQTISQAYWRLANLRPDSSECGVGRSKQATIHTTRIAYKLVCLSHEECVGWYQDQSNSTSPTESHATDLRSGSTGLRPELISLSHKISTCVPHI